MTDFDKIIFGVHSNAVTEGQQEELPHSWVSVDKNGEITTYGSWPSTNADVLAYGQEGGWNGQGTDVQKNIELASELQAAHSHYTELTPQQQEVLDQKLNGSHEWTQHDNCASWTSRVASDVTGEKVSAMDTVKGLHEDGYIIDVEKETSKGISKSIQELEQQKAQGAKDTAIAAAQEKSDVLQEAKNNQAGIDKSVEKSADLVEKTNAVASKIEAEHPNIDLTSDKEDLSDDMDLVHKLNAELKDKVDELDHVTSEKETLSNEIDPIRESNDDLNKDKIEQLDKTTPETDERMEAALRRQEYVSSLEEQQAVNDKEHEGR